MKLVYYRGSSPNFGDEVNTWMWPKLLPGILDENEDKLFLGIGSILGDEILAPYKKRAHKSVLGSGFVPEYHSRPNLSQKDWSIYFVRGPRTAKALGLASELAIGDSAILVRGLIARKKPSNPVISFMPHWQSVFRGRWEEVCALAGINMIDPRLPVETVFDKIQNSSVLIAEAMHGAIIADVLRVPWIPILPLNHVNRNKWLDWSEALSTSLKPYKIFPSSIEEARLGFMRKLIRGKALNESIEKAMVGMAANSLTKISRMSPMMSSDAALERAHTAMLDCVQKFMVSGIIKEMGGCF